MFSMTFFGYIYGVAVARQVGGNLSNQLLRCPIAGGEYPRTAVGGLFILSLHSGRVLESRSPVASRTLFTSGFCRTFSQVAATINR